MDSPPDNLDDHIRKVVQEETKELNKKVNDIYNLLVKLEGAGYFVKVLFFVVAPIVGAIVWLKDHVKL